MVPPEKLLVMSWSEGWEPLCNFLDKPIPDEPLPRANDAAAADAMAKKIVIGLGLRWLAVFAVLGCATHGALQLWRSKHD